MSYSPLMTIFQWCFGIIICNKSVVQELHPLEDVTRIIHRNGAQLLQYIPVFKDFVK